MDFSYVKCDCEACSDGLERCKRELCEAILENQYKPQHNSNSIVEADDIYSLFGVKSNDNCTLEISENGTFNISKDWEKIDNVYIWFQALKNHGYWNGKKYFVYKKPDGTFVAPFCGRMVDVIQDCKDEFREVESEAK
jgi:hypothetical protein